MIIPKLAVRNMVGAGAKTWLNAAVLSWAFVVIIGVQGLYLGFDEEVSRTMIAAEYGGGQYWVNGFDPYDPFSIADAHAVVPAALLSRIEAGRAVPVLIIQGTLYPQGRVFPALLKGIDPLQKLLDLPAGVLKPGDHEVPALIGERMAGASGLKKGDVVTVRWRDAKGTFDARDIQIAGLMSTTAASIDEGQVWLPLETLQEMAAMPGQATLVVTAKDERLAPAVAGWTFKDLGFLLKDIKALIKGKTVGASILYAILIFLAMLAVFNTQLLSIWKRRKEIGMMMALGVTRGRVIGLFTFEGWLNAVFAALAGALYGIPLLGYLAAHGFSFSKKVSDSFGFAISEKLYPLYSLALVFGTTALIFLITIIVSYLPTRKIAKLKPTDALRGRMS
jgi:ABC-type lipoprotein release transport system permease subunit